MGFPAWQPAVRCTSGPTPGALAFMRWFTETYGNLGGFNLGIYNCRTVRGGATTSLHGEGRACDLGFPVGDMDGDRLERDLLRVVGRLGIQCIIYEREIFSQKSPGGRPYTGIAPHWDHLHVEFTREAAAALTYTTVKQVMESVRRIPGTRILREGSIGYDVEFVQRKVDAVADGYFGPKTVKLVKQFENRPNIRKCYPKLIADGVVGPLTWRALGVTPKIKKKVKEKVV